MLLDSIKKDLKIAMKAKDTLKISTLRMITSSIKNMEISNRSSSNEDSLQDFLNDSEIIQLLSKMIKQRKESAEIYSKSNRNDLEKKEKDEIEIIEQYMPSQIDDEEVDELIEAVEEDTNKIHETADVFYHLLMYLEANDIKVEAVMEELEKRKK